MDLTLTLSLTDQPASLFSMDSETTPSSSSSSSSWWKYDVFLSFSPQDTSDHFTSHLYLSLLRSEVKTLVHQDKKQQHNSSNILKQIEKCRICIVVFSRNYAASTSRLEELSKIAECIDSVKQKQSVFLVFYDLNPCEVRLQHKHKGIYDKVFAEYEETFKQKVERWRNALTKVANLEDPASAWVMTMRKEINPITTQVINDIVRSAKNILGMKGTSGMDEIGGIQPQLEALEKLVDLDSKDVIRVIGIFGMHGSGITTLASLLYHRISHKFDAFCFLNINGVSYLQEQILREILQEEDLKVSDVEEGSSSLIATRLRNLKILLVLDDVGDIQILEELVGNHYHDWFGVGSRIIITTTDEHILKSYGVDQTYKVEPMKLEEIVQSWESHLSGDLEKEIFLDIACFFVGENIHDVIEILSDCNFYPAHEFEGLIRNSMITVSDDGKIEMHYLLQELGQKTIQREYPNKPGKRSRLWFDEDFRNVMETNTGTRNIKALVLNPKVPEESPLKVDGLSKMDGLQLLIIRNVNFSGDLKGLSKRLRYVWWHRFPFTCLPSSFEPSKLVQLIMPHSNIALLCNESKKLPNLRNLDLHGSKNLMETPHFERLPNLEKLNVEGCIGLVMLDPSITFLTNLKLLNLRNCTSLVSVPNNLFGQTSLEILNVAGCSKFAEFLDFDEVLSNQDLPLLEETGKQLVACGICREHAECTIEASSSTRTQDKYPTAKCIVGLDEIDGVCDNSYVKALDKFKDPYWREAFLTMSHKGKKAWLNSLV